MRPRTTPEHTASRAAGSADTEGLTHLTETGARLLAERLLALLAEGLLAELLLAERLLTVLAEGLLAELLLTLLTEGLLTELLLTLLTLLALLHQRQDRDRQYLLHGLLHSVPHTLTQRCLQCDGEVRVGLVAQALLLQLLLDLLDLLQRLLHALRDLLARLLTGLLHRLVDYLRERLRAPHLLLPELLQWLGTGHHRHESSIQRTGKPT
ncbi:hypothetical protein [Streptomyces sp. NPDC050287]|uniref:hypothetical protein n=1 Tax=Streptomyces sp. NPDC050287 TaxID=3365608 RepID=UPI00379FA64A